MSIGDKLRSLFGMDDDNSWNNDEDYFRSRHATGSTGSTSAAASGPTAVTGVTGGTDAIGVGASAAGDYSGSNDYDRARPAYQFGYAAGQSGQYDGRGFNDVEPDLRSHWDTHFADQGSNWDSVRGNVGDAFARGQERRVTRSEEELRVGKRNVQAGEVAVHKTVDTEHVTEQVPLMREEVTVERHAVTDADRAAAPGDIGEDEIRVAVHEEEAIVEKRPVVKEEIVIRKQAVQDTQTVEADLRKERVDIDDSAVRAKGTKGTTGTRDLDDTGRA